MTYEEVCLELGRLGLWGYIRWPQLCSRDHSFLWMCLKSASRDHYFEPFRATRPGLALVAAFVTASVVVEE